MHHATTKGFTYVFISLSLLPGRQADVTAKRHLRRSEHVLYDLLHIGDSVIVAISMCGNEKIYIARLCTPLAADEQVT